MLRKIVNVLVVLPLAILFVVFAVANRHSVTLSFDPFNSSDPALSLSAPLFVVLIAVALLGVVAGSTATWFGQGRWRKAARRHEADVSAIRAELADLRHRPLPPAPGGEGKVPAITQGAGLHAIPGPQQAAIGRDKSGATL